MHDTRPPTNGSVSLSVDLIPLHQTLSAEQWHGGATCVPAVSLAGNAIRSVGWLPLADANHANPVPAGTFLLY